jgi:hypothetical protein
MIAYETNGFIHGRCGTPDRRLRPGDHDDRQTKLSGSRDLAVGRLAAAVLGDDDLDAVGAQERKLIGFRKRTAIEDVMRADDAIHCCHGIDAAHDVAVLRAGREAPGLLPSDGKKHSARRSVQQSHRVIHILGFDPLVAGLPLPFGPLQPHERHGSGGGSLDSIGGDTCGERVRGVDEHIDLPCPQPFRQPLRAAKAADTHVTGLRQRILRSAGKRQRHAHIAARNEAAGKRACLAGAAEDENMRDGHDAI